MAEAWDRLTGAERRSAYIAMAALALAPAEAVALLRTRLHPGTFPTAADLDRVVRQLDSETFADRENAEAELERFGPNAVAGVNARLERAARLNRPPPLEAWKRMARFLNKYDSGSPSPYLLRCVRGVAVLEAIGTPDARALLAELAKGPAGDILTREARASNGGGR